MWNRMHLHCNLHRIGASCSGIYLFFSIIRSEGKRRSRITLANASVDRCGNAGDRGLGGHCSVLDELTNALHPQFGRTVHSIPCLELPSQMPASRVSLL